MSISAVILTKNSSTTLEKCLQSLKWCNEILVVDDNSTDETEKIAKKMGAFILKHSLENNFSEQRNYGLEHAKGEWVLFIDSDEVVSSHLQEEIERKINKENSKVKGYYIQRIDNIWGKTLRYGEVGNIWLIRLARKNSGRWQGKVHETWEIKGKKEKLTNVVNHFPHPQVSEFISRINYYSTLRAQELYKNNIKVSVLDIILYPKAKFIVNYFLKLGFFDGIPGFIVAVIMSFYSFLVRAKLWQLLNSHQ